MQEMYFYVQIYQKNNCANTEEKPVALEVF